MGFIFNKKDKKVREFPRKQYDFGRELTLLIQAEIARSAMEAAVKFGPLYW